MDKAQALRTGIVADSQEWAQPLALREQHKDYRMDRVTQI